MNKTKRKVKMSREFIINIVANHNNVSKEIAARYTDSELQEVLKQALPNNKIIIK